MSDSDSESELIGRKHQELQALAYFTKKKLDFEYDTSDIPEFESVIRSRPDFLFRGEINVIVEIDENAHAGYSPDDEVSRMKTIWKAFDKNVVFIRLAVDRSKELSGRILKDVYHMILEYQSLTDTRSRLVVHYVNYPSKELKKYRRYNGNINIVNFENVEDFEEEDEDDTPSTVTTVTTTTTVDKTQFTCDRCGYEATQKCNLRTHIINSCVFTKKIAMPNALKPSSNTCARCGFNAARSRNLRLHLSRKKVCVPKDSKSAIPREDLIKQIDDSKKNKTFICSYCSKLYTTDKTLTAHKKICPLANKIVPLTQEQFDNLVARTVHFT